MRSVRLGRTSLELTPIGLGTWAIGGAGRVGWGPQRDEDSIAAIHEAIDAGINWIDTAPVYGAGHSEKVVGRAIRGLEQRPFIFTKCGRVVIPDGSIRPDLTEASVRQQCEASLRRLGIEAIDLYQIHWPDPDSQLEEAWATLVALRDEGKVRAIGLSNASVDQLERCHRIAPVETLQPPYSLITREIEDVILPWCARHELGVLAYSPMYSGLLSGSMTAERARGLPDTDWRSRDDEFQEPRLSRNLETVEQLRAIGEPAGLSPGQLAVAWALQRDEVTAVIVGARAPGQIGSLAAAADVSLGLRDALQ